mmetsp:Transcript_54879/g.175988  ORF Transcript_54879/g.175988 Transcript_54879/m.175988 type:complete len:235 (-) Transcript_54879:70-774(-)
MRRPKSPMMRQSCLLSLVFNSRPIRFMTKFSFSVSFSMSSSSSSSIFCWSFSSVLIVLAVSPSLCALCESSVRSWSCCSTICCWSWRCLSRNCSFSCVMRLRRSSWLAWLRLPWLPPVPSACRLSDSILPRAWRPVTLSWMSLTVARLAFTKSLRLAISELSNLNFSRFSSTILMVAVISCRSKSSCRSSPAISACSSWKRWLLNVFSACRRRFHSSCMLWTFLIAVCTSCLAT